MQTTTFRLRCLGPAMLLGSDDARVSFETRKHLVLLYYLARHPGRPVSRDELTDLFWHGDEEKKARHSLSHAVSLINKSMRAEAIAVVSAGRLMLPEGMVDLDVRDFERLVAEGQFIQARELWNGRLFEGYWIPRAPKLEEWLAVERGRLERVFRRVLHELIEDHRAAGDHEMMRREAEALLDLDELDEKAMLGYLEALTLLGDRTLALRRFKEFEKRIVSELDAEPSSALKSWAKRQKRGEQSPISISRPVERGVLPAVRPLYGRDAEFESLWTLWEETATGRGKFVIIEGPAGIGKTALGAKLANQIHVAGGSVCFIRCYRTEKPVPFTPVTAFVNQVSRLPGFLGVGSDSLSELTRLHSDLRHRFPHVPQASPSDDLSRHRLCDAALEAVKSVSDEQSLLIFVDDIQDADEASLALLHYLGRQVSDLRTMLVCAIRTGEALTEVERTFLTSSRTACLAKFVALGQLPSDQIVRLAHQVLAQRGFPSSEALFGEVVRKSWGNPLLAIEAATAATTGQARSEGQTDESPRESFDASSIERLRALSPNARLIASTLAAAGRPLSDYELTEVADLPAAELATATAELDSQGFTRYHAGYLAFQHERYQGAAAKLASPAIRQAIHLALANNMRKAAVSNGSIRFELAKHLEAGGRHAQARKQSLLAAEYAASVGAIRSKADALELALTLKPNDEETAVDLAHCYLIVNDSQALARLRSSNKLGRDSADFRYFDLAARVQSGEMAFGDGCDHLLELVNGHASNFRMEPEALLLLLRVADKTFRYGTVRQSARRLRKFASSYCSFATAYVFAKYYWAERALPFMEAALKDAQLERNWTVEQLARDGLGIVLKQVGKYRDSVQQFQHAVNLARKTMNPHAEIAALQNRAVTELCLGEFDRMAATHREVERIGGTTSALDKHRLYNDALVDLQLRDHNSAATKFAKCYRECVNAGFPVLAMQCAAGSALVSQRIGDLQGLANHAAAVRALRPHNDQTSMSWIDIAALAFDDALNNGEPEKALRQLRRSCRQYSRRDVSFWMALELERLNLRIALKDEGTHQDRDRLIQLSARYEAKAVQKSAFDLV